MDEQDWTVPRDAPGTAGDFLRRFRDQLRLTQMELAQKAGVDRSQVAKIEAERDVRIGTLARIVEALGCRLVLTARSPRPLKDMAEDHVPARLAAWEERLRKRDRGAIWPSSTDSPS